MPISRSNALVIKNRVALSGSKVRGATGSWHLKYIAERRGVVRGAGAEGGLDPELAHMAGMDAGFIDYMGERPGAVGDRGLALFDQFGDVTLAEARRRFDESRGAVLRTSISVARQDACALELATKRDWQDFVRANWTRQCAHMMGIPESRVRYVAAYHVNQRNNLHVHVVSWDAAKEDPWDRLLSKRLMCDANRALVDEALKPELSRLARERTIARDEAVAAVRSQDASVVRGDIELPRDGSLKYAHLRRYHPDVADRVERAAADAVERSEAAKRAVRRHGEAVREMAVLKGLEGAECDRYQLEAEQDLRKRLANAAISAMEPNRHARPAGERMCRDPTRSRGLGDTQRLDRVDGGAHPSDMRLVATDIEGDVQHEGAWERGTGDPDGLDTLSPSTARRSEAMLAEELEGCLTEDELGRALDAAANGRELDGRTIGRLPSVDAAVRGAGASLDAICRASSREDERDTGASVGRDVTRAATRALADALMRSIEAAKRSLVAKGAGLEMERARGAAMDR